MAISRFQQSSGLTDLSAFFDWLNANKSGTFLAGFTITNTTTSNTNDTINIVGTNSSIIIKTGNSASTTVFKFTSGSFSVDWVTPSSSNARAYVVGALLCSKGLILQYNGKYMYSADNYDSYGVCVTIDNNNELASIVTDTQIPQTTTEIDTWDTCAAGSTSYALRKCRPYFQANRTALAPITAQGNDVELSLPYAYAAISTQLNQEGLYPVAINGDNYITNGVWYIKDGA